MRRSLYAWGIDTGSQNSLSIALDPPLLMYQSGLELRVLVAADNNGPATIRVNGLSTQQIIKKDGTTLLAGDLRQGGVSVFVYDGAHFQLVSGAAGSTTISSGWYNGADYIVDGGTTNHIVGAPAVLPVAYNAGQGFLVLVAHTNTGAVDINVNALGVKSVVLPTGEPLKAGDIIANMLIRICYDGVSFTMLSPIDHATIQETLTRIVGPNTGADFPDLNTAFDWAGRRRFDRTGTLILSLQGQSTGSPIVHNYSVPITFAHPQGDRIQIVGPGMNFVPLPANFGSSANTAANVVTEAASMLTMLRTAFQCEIRFTTAAAPYSFQINNTKLGLLKNVLITGPGLQAGPMQSLISVRGSQVLVDCVAAASCVGSCWWVGYGSNIRGRHFYAVGSGANAVSIFDGSDVDISDGFSGTGQELPTGTACVFVVADAFSDGVWIVSNSSLIVGSATYFPRVYSVLGNGIDEWGDSSVWFEHGQFINCVASAMTVRGSYSYAGFASVFASNFGFITGAGAALHIPSTSTAAVTFVDYDAGSGSFIYAAGFTNGAAQFSPARNTFGNEGAYISA